MSRSAIPRHAEKHPGSLGKIKLTNGHPEPDGIYGAAVVLTRKDRVEYHAAFAGGGAVSMTKTGTEPLPELSLFAGRQQ